MPVWDKIDVSILYFTFHAVAQVYISFIYMQNIYHPIVLGLREDVCEAKQRNTQVIHRLGVLVRVFVGANMRLFVTKSPWSW